LFCGIGGFHEALRAIRPDFDCVYACDTDIHCQKVYRSNFNINAYGDIRDTKELVPDHQLLCAGFPCQPFSKSGSQLGFLDLIRGTLFEDIMDIVRNKQPEYVLLENVANLLSHDKGRTLKIIEGSLDNAGYKAYTQILSPHEFGVPHNRKRVFIVGINRKKVSSWSEFGWPQGTAENEPHVNSIRDNSSSRDEDSISKQNQEVFDHWSTFMSHLPKGVTPPTPTWSMEFGRNYPLSKIHPISRRSRAVLCEILREYEGKIVDPKGSRKSIESRFPPYIRKMGRVMPKWKRDFIEKNRKFWRDYGKHIPEGWLEKTKSFKETHQKFEWHVGPHADRNIMSHMIHLRPSGIRVSKLNWIPSLVAIAQIPIVGPWGRKISPREAANAQSFDIDFKLHETPAVAYRQLGNSVNITVAQEVIRQILQVEALRNPISHDSRLREHDSLEEL